jgi:MFS family permease
MPSVPVDVPLGMPASVGTEHRWRYEGWTVACASAAGVFCWSLPPLSFPVFLKPIAEEFAWNRQMVASAFGVSALVAAVFAAPVGYLVDRVGARRVVLPSLAVAGAAFLVRAWIEPRFWQVALLFGLSGLAGLGAGPVPASTRSGARHPHGGFGRGRHRASARRAGTHRPLRLAIGPVDARRGHAARPAADRQVRSRPA